MSTLYLKINVEGQDDISNIKKIDRVFKENKINSTVVDIFKVCRLEEIA